MPIWWRAWRHKPIDYPYKPWEAFHDCPLGCQLCSYIRTRNLNKLSKILNAVLKTQDKNFPKARMLKP